jgi:hypothetical protein
MSPRPARGREGHTASPPPVAPPDLDEMPNACISPTIRRLHTALAVRAEAKSMGHCAYLDTLFAEDWPP